MGIRLQSLRIKGFRGFRNIEIDFEKITVLVGTNNSGKTISLFDLPSYSQNAFGR